MKNTPKIERRSFRKSSGAPLARRLEEAKRHQSAGNLLAAARVLIPLLKPGKASPEVTAARASLAKQMFAAASESLRLLDLRNANALVRMLLSFGGLYRIRAMKLKASMRFRFVRGRRARGGGGGGLPSSAGEGIAGKGISEPSPARRKRSSAKKVVVKKAAAKKTAVKKVAAKKTAAKAVARKPVKKTAAKRAAAGKKAAPKKSASRRIASVRNPRTGEPLRDLSLPAPSEPFWFVSEVKEEGILQPLERSPREDETVSANRIPGIQSRRLNLGLSKARRLRVDRENVSEKSATETQKSAGKPRRSSHAAAPEQVTAERDPVVQRTPHMEFSCDEPLVPGTRFDVTIFADQQQPKAGEESGDIVLSAPLHVQSFKVDVKLLVSDHFEIDAGSGGRRRKKVESQVSGMQQLVIRRDAAESSRAVFTLAVRAAKDLVKTPPFITALFQYKGRPSGRVSRKPVIAGLEVVASSRRSSTAETSTTFAANVTPRVADVPPTLRVPYEATAADMTISVLELPQMDGCNFHMIVDAPVFSEHWEGPWTLRLKTEDLVSGAMATFTSTLNADASADARISALKGAGQEMFKATPKEFQKLFWRILDSGKPLRSILIVSEEPFIPWEIMVPLRPKMGGVLETRGALGAEFAVGRWVTSNYVSPPQEIAISQTYIVAPNYPPKKQLPNAALEASMLQKLFSPSAIITPALVKNIDKVLAAGGTTLLHFVCHGKSGFPQSISLEQAKEDLTCWQIAALPGFTSSFPTARTFVFLNACEVGRLVPALAGIGGFGNSFVEIGSSGVIAPLWSVDDGIAHQVAEAFYKAVIDSPAVPFAEILRAIRKNAYEGNAEDSWAAYCFYGDPLAHRVLTELT
jgi:hypothetical protein